MSNSWVRAALPGIVMLLACSGVLPGTSTEDGSTADEHSDGHSDAAPATGDAGVGTPELSTGRGPPFSPEKLQELCEAFTARARQASGRSLGPRFTQACVLAARPKVRVLGQAQGQERTDRLLEEATACVATVTIDLQSDPDGIGVIEQCLEQASAQLLPP